MIGRAGLVYTIGFGFILALIGRNLDRYTISTEGNMAAYCDATISHNLAIAGANVALAKFYNNRTWSGSFTQDLEGVSGMNGKFTATLTNTGISAKLRSISEYKAWWAEGGAIHDTVDVFFAILDSNAFTKYAFYTGFKGNDQFWFGGPSGPGGDSVWGEVRSDGGIHMMQGNPVFNNKVYYAKQIQGPGKPIYKQGVAKQTVHLDYPTDLSKLIGAAASGGKLIVHGGDVDVQLTPGTAATGDGMVKFYDHSTHMAFDSVSLNPAGSFNGAIYVQSNIHVLGSTVDGRVTIGSSGNVSIDKAAGYGQDIRYEQDPLAGPSDDVLGLVATNNITINYNNDNVRIDAAMFTLNGSFNANWTGGGTGVLTVTGSIAESDKGTIMSSSGNGYYKRYHWDARFANPAYVPPYFPGSGPKNYYITNWWESSRRKAFVQ